ncbi:hypothetical protein [Endothiovibrio diazotrophicus]
MEHALLYPLTIVLALAALAAIAAGIWLLLRPDDAHRLTDDRSLYQLIRWTRRPYQVERYVYRHHRFSGALLIAGASLLLFGLWGPTDTHETYLFAFTHEQTLSTALVLALQTTGIVLTTGALFAFVVGVAIFHRPSLLKGFESWANQPVTLRLLLDALRTLRHAPNRWTSGHPRIIALLLLAIGVYLLALILHDLS